MPQVIFGSEFSQRIYTWGEWKTLYLTRSDVRAQWADDGSKYTVYFYAGPEVHICEIWRTELPYTVVDQQTQNDLDRQDFEDNFKDNFNKELVQRFEISSVVNGALPLAQIVKSAEVAVTSRNETTILSHTVTGGKKFYLTFFGGAAFTALPIIVRIRVNGTSMMVATPEQGEQSSTVFSFAAPIATGGQAITATVEGQISNGTAWICFMGFEN